MPSFSRSGLHVALGLLAVFLLSADPVRAQGKKSKEISFNTFDGVKIQGTLYPNNGGKRDAVVLMLHNFDIKKGGNSQQQEWTDFAASLQKEGFTVLTFDFRGFGDSRSVEKSFWSYPQNGPTGIRRRGKTLPERIDHKDFAGGYLVNLVNDVAAAKAYLDRRNDAKELNSANLIVIGAGEGATVGAMWLCNECRRRRDPSSPPQLRPVPGSLGAPEINDVACGIWLTISPKLGTRTPNVTRWILEAGKKNKVPMAFVYGKGDSTGHTLANGFSKAIKSQSSKPGEFATTGVYAVPDTKLTAMQLLGAPGTEKWIIKKYLEPVLDARGAREQKDRRSETSAYWYVTNTGLAYKISKKGGQEAPEVDVKSLLSP